ncbi:hypothetical protein GCM10011309_01070 [Litorimonas cladophorae]|uniref:Uncharacterized protein n=1 Tax=Litorimonas cladophorae TaxID=1220491 RepID=A0A918NBR6_9PROT|nr:hypothetical protein [Litorimonas cladophorae]GGX56130.1 hypothetical protein GCM10011309_01070 [Litorimonas cladophorae]
MNAYRLGDRQVIIAGVETRLRLTLSGLAEITSALGTDTPSVLAARLREATDADWNIVLRAMAQPRPKTGLTQADLGEILPALSAVIADGLNP